MLEKTRTVLTILKEKTYHGHVTWTRAARKEETRTLEKVPSNAVSGVKSPRLGGGCGQSPGEQNDMGRSQGAGRRRRESKERSRCARAPRESERKGRGRLGAITSRPQHHGASRAAQTLRGAKGTDVEQRVLGEVLHIAGQMPHDTSARRRLVAVCSFDPAGKGDEQDFLQGPEDTLLQRRGRLRGWTWGRRQERESLREGAACRRPAQRGRQGGPVPRVLRDSPGNAAPARVVPWPVGPMMSSVLPRHRASNPRP